MKIMLDKGAYMPLRAHSTDAGLDLRTPKEVTVPKGGSVCIDTGVHVELPKGYYGKLESKSGLNVKHSVVSWRNCITLVTRITPLMPEIRLFRW